MFQKKLKKVKPFGSEVTVPLRVTLCDINTELLACFENEFSDFPGVEIIEGSLVHVACDAIVSPANSFGDMGGGVDKVIDDHYRGKCQESVALAIREQFLGELPVGMAILVQPSPKKLKVICAPTMRVPGNVSDTVNAYLAMRAALVCAMNNHLGHIALSGMCCGVGRMPYAESALQMRRAYEVVVLEEWKSIVHAAQAPFVMRRS